MRIWGFSEWCSWGFLSFGVWKLRVWVVGSLHFEEAYSPHFRGSKFLKTLLHLKMRTLSMGISTRYGIVRSSRRQKKKNCVHSWTWHILNIPLFCTCSMAVVAVGLWHTKLLWASKHTSHHQVMSEIFKYCHLHPKKLPSTSASWSGLPYIFCFSVNFSNNTIGINLT